MFKGFLEKARSLRPDLIFRTCTLGACSRALEWHQAVDLLGHQRNDARRRYGQVLGRGLQLQLGRRLVPLVRGPRPLARDGRRRAEDVKKCLF